MNRIRVSDNFFLDEFIDPRIYSQRGERSIQLIDSRIMFAAQYIREQSGEFMTINNWARGGTLRERGLRLAGTNTGALWSQHKYGRAIDINIGSWTAKQMFDFVMSHEKYLVQRQIVTVIEDIRDTPRWLHMDCRYTGQDKIVIIRA
jgi:hypothetical protein